MRRVAAVLLAALAAAPALAQQGEGPSLAVVQAPEYTVGDFWSYRVTLVGENGTSFPQNQTVRVVALEAYGGVPAVRLFTASEQFVPGDPQSGDLRATSNKTSWVAQRTLGLLRIEEVIDRSQLSPVYTIHTHREVNWTFHQPMDLYQFPIVRDDAWVVLTNATIESNTTLYTHVKDNPRNTVPTRYESGNVTQASTTRWVRADTLNISGRSFEGVVLVSQSGNATIRDFYSPAVGNLVRREILNETGALVETSTLMEWRLAKPPATVGPRPTDQGVLPLAGAAVAGGIAALVALALWRRVKPRGEAWPPAPEPGPEPAEPPAEPPGDAPPEPEREPPRP